MGHIKPEDRDKAILWAKDVLENKEHYLILDTETTGLDQNDVIVQISIMDLNGNDLINTLIKPTKRKRISTAASSIHGIKMPDLSDSPTFAEIVNKVEKIVEGKVVLIYNADFDERLIDQTCYQDECKCLRLRTECVMKQYSAFVGTWSEYHYDYKFQKLPGGDHSALGDCKATLKVLQRMANSKLSISSPNKSSELMTDNRAENIELPNNKWWKFW